LDSEVRDGVVGDLWRLLFSIWAWELSLSFVTSDGEELFPGDIGGVWVKPSAESWRRSFIDVSSSSKGLEAWNWELLAGEAWLYGLEALSKLGVRSQHWKLHIILTETYLNASDDELSGRPKLSLAEALLRPCAIE
jgi:hypothetical protein